MILVLIDILERLLSWLKPFSGNKVNFSSTKNQLELAVPMSNDLIARFNELSVALPVIDKFEELSHDPTINTDPKIYGVVADYAGNRVIGPVKASPKVWNEMFAIYGGQYLIRNI